MTDPDRKISLREVISMRKKQMAEKGAIVLDILAPDPFENCSLLLLSIRRKTGICLDLNSMGEHNHKWDKNHPESPERIYQIVNRLAYLLLLSRGEVIPTCKHITPQDIAMIHSPEHFDRLYNICKLKTREEIENETKKYDAVYFCQGTHESAVGAATCAINLIKQVATGLLHNGFAIIRPPGHHARYDQFGGYCFFNNIAIAAETCIQQKYAEKILIFDYDVHHGEGIQRAFYKRKDVLYISIHRYENGTFWPNLREGSFDYIGEGEGKGYNINIPLNNIGLRDEDYLAIIIHILLPVSYEFQPDLVIFAAGYDACMGCPEGQMELTPSFYSHLVHLMSGIAKGKLALVLEGGYFMPSLAEGVAQSLKALHGDPCPQLKPMKTINHSVIETINNVKGALYNYWKCFSSNQRFQHTEANQLNSCEEQIVHSKYFGEVLTPPYHNDEYVKSSREDISYYSHLIQGYKDNERNYLKYKRTGYTYDDNLSLHKSEGISHEKPERITRILEIMKESKLYRYCKLLKITRNSRNDFHLCLEVHHKSYLDQLMTRKLTASQDLYFNEHTPKAALKSVSALLTVVDAVITETITNGAALIRPPGHHATIDAAQGFCFINNVAVAAKYALGTLNINRVLIVDFDVHHGNGTQDIFYNTNEVLYISIHRFDKGHFYPSKPSGGMEFIGHGLGEGYNVNIPFNGGPMGNSEYLAAFLNIILPIAYSFAPQLVLVSAGFDAGIHDPLGGYQVSPEMFGHFIYLLKPLAEGKLVLALEGGYNVNTTAYSMIMCLKALLGQPIPTPEHLFSIKINTEAAKVINDVIQTQKQYWPVLHVTKKISDVVYHTK